MHSWWNNDKIRISQKILSNDDLENYFLGEKSFIWFFFRKIFCCILGEFSFSNAFCIIKSHYRMRGRFCDEEKITDVIFSLNKKIRIKKKFFSNAQCTKMLFKKWKPVAGVEQERYFCHDNVYYIADVIYFQCFYTLSHRWTCEGTGNDWVHQKLSKP